MGKEGEEQGKKGGMRGARKQRGLPNELALQLQFAGFFSSKMQLQEIVPLRNSQGFSANTVT